MWLLIYEISKGCPVRQEGIEILCEKNDPSLPDTPQYNYLNRLISRFSQPMNIDLSLTTSLTALLAKRNLSIVAAK